MLKHALIALIVLQGWMHPFVIAEAAPPLPDNALLEELKAGKGYILDIRYGDTQAPFGESAELMDVTPTQAFLDNAAAIRIGVDIDQTGTFNTAGIGVGYALIPEKDAPPILKFAFLNADPDNFTSVHTRIPIQPGEWTAVCGTAFNTLDGDTLYSYIVVRLTKQ
ncbi:hypothetical protein [Marinobacter fonticola]|uniref:hypothetical protein n=1 Tax=Marinobacter fonticola TaxID=2603215 RepID=UPI0011E7CA11|nr:hypothetical protein [Marinobacter fonticola]